MTWQNWVSGILVVVTLGAVVVWILGHQCPPTSDVICK